MRRSRRELETALRLRGEQVTEQTERADLAEEAEEANARRLTQALGELSRAKDVIASHLVAVGHPSTVLHTVRDLADSLHQALTDAGVDLSLELARLGGADLHTGPTTLRDLPPGRDTDALRRRIRHLERQLDDALSLDAPDVAAGVGWQDRREQKMRYDT